MDIFNEICKRDTIDICETVNDIELLSDQLLGLIESYIADEIIVVCIGTDRNVGDSLAPIVGTRLKNTSNCIVYGIIGDTINALNIDGINKHIGTNYPNALVIVVDAGLGKEEDIGKITVNFGSIYPSKGIGREDLLPIGDINIVGIVGRKDIQNPLDLLHQASLYDIINMSDIIVKILKKAIDKWEILNKINTHF